MYTVIVVWETPDADPTEYRFDTEVAAREWYGHVQQTFPSWYRVSLWGPDGAIAYTL